MGKRVATVRKSQEKAKVLEGQGIFFQSQGTVHQIREILYSTPAKFSEKSEKFYLFTC